MPFEATGSVMGRLVDNVIGVVNGCVGDRLAQSRNSLATQMRFVTVTGEPMTLPAQGTPRVAVFLHGLMNTESCWRRGDGKDFGARLAAELGFTPLYVRYNSGLAIPDNGAALAALLDDVVARWPGPLEEILLVGFSLGGLVMRSACQLAAARQSSRWLPKVQRAMSFGTPHLGAPTERKARAMLESLRKLPGPVGRGLAQLGDVRSMGIKDLGDAIVRDEDRLLPRGGADGQVVNPMPPSIEHLFVVTTVFDEPELALARGDGINPIPTMTGGRVHDAQTFHHPPRDVRVLKGFGHNDMPRHDQVYACLLELARLALSSPGTAQGSALPPASTDGAVGARTVPGRRLSGR